VGHSEKPSLAIAASHSVLIGMPLAVGELRGGVTGALADFPCMTCKGGRPALLLVLAVPLLPPPPPWQEDKPLSHGMRDVPSLAPGHEDVGLTDGDGETSICCC
jgi:hypothetical protein